MEKVARIALLYDFYGQLLTPKQREILELYYQQDLSFGEIAEEMGVSRQAVFDILKRTEKILDEYEVKLGLVDKFLAEREKLKEAAVLLDQYRLTGEPLLVEKISGIIHEILELEEF